MQTRHGETCMRSNPPICRQSRPIGPTSRTPSAHSFATWNRSSPGARCAALMESSIGSRVPSDALGLQIGAQQVSGVSVIDMRMSRHFVGDRSNDNQPQMSSCGAASPEHVIEDFVTNFATFAAKVDAGLLPIQAIRLADVLRGEDLGSVLAPRVGRIRETEAGIFAATGQQVHSGDRRFKEGAITEAAIDRDQQLPVGGALLIQQLAKALDQTQSGGGKIFILAQRAVLLQLVFGSAFPWLGP